MSAEYRFRCSEEFLVEGFKRYRRQHVQRFWLRPLKVVGSLGLGALLAIFIYSKLVLPSLLIAFFLLLLAIGPRPDYWFIRRRFRKSPFYNSDVVIRLSERGYLGQDANSRTELSWRVFTKGYRFADGFLLLSGPQQFHWWPDAALAVGRISEVEAMVRQHVPDYRVAEQRVAGDAPDAARP